jgi:hypothetical protein
LIKLLSPLRDEILLDDGAACERDNECRSTCCNTYLCSDSSSCSSARFGLTIAIVLICAAVLIISLVTYYICMRHRRTTRYDERLNSISGPSGGKKSEKLIKNHQINEEDMEDFTKHEDDNNGFERTNSARSEARINTF